MDNLVVHPNFSSGSYKPAAMSREKTFGKYGKNKQRQQKMSKNVYSSKTITTYKLKKIIKKLKAHKIIIKLKDSFL